ncbi:hypothetical protein TPHA_0F02060 [Tetrapisispora phaffii CBS 4417]|uniref:Uncharacterized protein n=1 Tax=Tetrapisispora phaffii (strain ATCC 24235 / CBS 4417 / NBRC 1672 / NRRL Y-8282 / UCD 70-5) TaxID=1071381 RepID=G8BVA6_TETPH|nr:hypothetical protein TPHA_0F02060 [Tetrapisispora phaffii CBS 4417]CCE63688.1 hypothetical protein TPHA_0F02060 [Tetrapisispora phaffii CBS 4417]
MAKKKSKNNSKNTPTGPDIPVGTSNSNINKLLNKTKGAIPRVESFTNLTKPALFSIYDDDIIKIEDTINEEQKANDIEFTNHAKKDEEPYIPMINENIFLTEKFKKKSLTGKIFHIIFVLSMLSLSGICYHDLSRNLHDKHLLHPDLAARPLLVLTEFTKYISLGLVPDWACFSLEGIIFGLLIPFLYTILNVSPRAPSNSSVIRSINAMLGVIFGIRRVEWSSSLQASGAWALLNVIMWLFFDGTLSMLLPCSGLGIISCIIGYQNIEDVSQALFFMDFYFLGFMLFGKIGIYLLSF